MGYGPHPRCGIALHFRRVFHRGESCPGTGLFNHARHGRHRSGRETRIARMTTNGSQACGFQHSRRSAGLRPGQHPTWKAGGLTTDAHGWTRMRRGDTNCTNRHEWEPGLRDATFEAERQSPTRPASGPEGGRFNHGCTRMDTDAEGRHELHESARTSWDPFLIREIRVSFPSAFICVHLRFFPNRSGPESQRIPFTQGNRCMPIPACMIRPHWQSPSA
jgi:hypothetical protein